MFYRFLFATTLTFLVGWFWRHLPASNSERLGTKFCFFVSRWFGVLYATDRYKKHTTNTKTRAAQHERLLFLLTLARRRSHTHMLHTILWMWNQARDGSKYNRDNMCTMYDANSSFCWKFVPLLCQMMNFLACCFNCLDKHWAPDLWVRSKWVRMCMVDNSLSTAKKQWRSTEIKASIKDSLDYNILWQGKYLKTCHLWSMYDCRYPRFSSSSPATKNLVIDLTVAHSSFVPTMIKTGRAFKIHGKFESPKMHTLRKIRWACEFWVLFNMTRSQSCDLNVYNHVNLWVSLTH